MRRVAFAFAAMQAPPRPILVCVLECAGLPDSHMYEYRHQNSLSHALRQFGGGGGAEGLYPGCGG